MTKKKHTEGKDKSGNSKDKTSDNKDILQQYNTDLTPLAATQKEEGTIEQPAVEKSAEAVTQEEQIISKEAELTEKLAEVQDKYLRLMAEFENYRKRTLREKIDLVKNAGEKILVGILTVKDDFERALGMMEESSDPKAIKEGIEFIYNKLSDFLKQQGLREIESLNCDFNVDLHEAVNKITVEDESMKGKVVEVLQKGYYLNDKVIRFSKVVIGE
ncbi:MAG: nucleotide exchange factor GrpE [Bacteroidales bacterium]